MEISNKTKVITVVSIFISGLAIGRFTVPTKTLTVKELVEVEKKKVNTSTDTDRNKHIETITVEQVKPDGTKQTTTTKIEDTTTNRKTDKSVVSDTSVTQIDKKEVTKDTGRTNLSLLAGINVLNPASGFVYGAHIQRDILGPFTLGVFGFTDARLGVSIGLGF